MSEPPRLYCCVEHRDQTASSMSLIDYLSKAYMEALKIQIKQLKAMKECRNKQTDFSALLQLPEDERERIENMLATAEHLLEQFSQQRTGSLSQHKKALTNESVRESLILESDHDHCVSLGDNTEISVFNEEELLRSPVLMNRQPKSRKSLPATIVSDSAITSEDELHTSQTLLARSDKKQTKMYNNSPMEDGNKYSSSVLNCTANNDVIECTPIQKSYKKIALSKLYNIDTSITHTGKKVRQAKLAFEPFKENVDISICQKSPMVKSVSNKYDLLEADENQTNVDEIIENSPERSQIFSIAKSRSKSIQERKPSNHRITQLFCNDNDNSLKKQCKDKENVPLRDTKMTDFSQFSPLLSSTQYDPIALTKKTNDASLLSHYNETSTVMQQKKDVLPSTNEIKKVEDSNVNIYPSKRKLPESDGTSHNDETYFDPTNTNGKDQHKQDVTASETVPSVKRNLLTTYDRPPPKVKKQDNSFRKPARTKEERAKLQAVDCWECEQYFNNIGLSESQIKVRLKACSRHRSKFAVRQSTPEGFWDEGFPDTQSSSIGDRD